MRGDIARLSRCTLICTQGEDTIKRSKPFKYAYEKEIVMYAYFKKLDYFSTECIYSPDAYRGHARVFLKDLEAARPSAIIDIIHSGEQFEVKEEVKKGQKVQRKSKLRLNALRVSFDGVCVTETCQRCGYMSSNTLCKACTLLEGLERGIAEAGIVSILLAWTDNASETEFVDRPRKAQARRIRPSPRQYPNDTLFLTTDTGCINRCGLRSRHSADTACGLVMTSIAICSSPFIFLISLFPYITFSCVSHKLRKSFAVFGSILF